MNISLNELKLKQVVNVYDGKALGHICDVIFDDCYGKLLGFVVPGIKKFWDIFWPSNDIFIPFQNICKIGIDTILVELVPNTAQQPSNNFSAIKATNYETQ